MTELSLPRYSHGMSIRIEPPEISPGYPYKRRLWPAWRQMWDALRESGHEYLDGTVLARSVAAEHNLSPATLQAILSRAVRAGLLGRTERTVGIQVHRKRRDGSTFTVPSERIRAFYRIKG